MTAFVKEVNVAKQLCEYLIAADFGPFFGTPGDLLSPLHTAAHQRVGVLTVAREDNAIGIAAGTSLAGRFPVVLMQNRGLGQTASAIAALVVPYRIPMLLIVGLSELRPKPSHESTIMGGLTAPLLDGLGIEAVTFDPSEQLAPQVDQVGTIVHKRLRPAALLVSPATIGGIT